MKSKLENINGKRNTQNYLIGIDIGTSATKMTVLDLKGDIVYSKAEEYKIDYLPKGKVQQNPWDWYNSLCLLLRDAYTSGSLEKKKVMAIGVSSQSNALIPVSTTGDLLYPAILYLDKRSIDICNSFKGTAEEKRIYKLTGSTLKPSYTGPQISWILKNEPDIYKNTYKFLTANGFIIYKLTGKFSQDYTQTGMTGIFNREKECWSDELLSYFDISEDKLSKIYKPYEIVGQTNKLLTKITGLPTGIPVIAGALDVASTMLGSGCIDIGSCLIEMGSVINIANLTNKLIRDKNLQTYPSAIPGIHIVAGSVDGAGNTINWFLNNIYRGSGTNEHITDRDIFNNLNKEIINTALGSGNIIFLPFMVGMRTPRSDLNTKGSFLGIKVSSRKIDIFRSILEGCAYGLKHNLEFIYKKKIDLIEVIASGGASRDKFWLQIMADVLNIHIKRSYYTSGASIGSAMLAGVGCGVFNGFEQAKELVCKYDLDFNPKINNSILYDKYYRQYKSFVKSLILELDRLENI